MTKKRKNFRPYTTLIALTSYQTLPIVEVAFLEDNSTFVSYIVVMTFGKYIKASLRWHLCHDSTTKKNIWILGPVQMYWDFWKRRSLSPFTRKKLITYPSTLSVFESFSAIHTKTLKRKEEEKLRYVFCSSMWFFQACWGYAITIGWLIDVEGCVQSAEQRPYAMLNASTAYQSLPIVEVAFLEDNSAFVSYMLLMTFGK